MRTDEEGPRKPAQPAKQRSGSDPLDSLAGDLAQQFGFPPELAQLIVGFASDQLPPAGQAAPIPAQQQELPRPTVTQSSPKPTLREARQVGHAGKSGVQKEGKAPKGLGKKPARKASTSTSNSLASRLQSGQGVDARFLLASGLAQELAKRTGLDADQAARSLAVALNKLI
ncbi:MAG: hypothetical protein JXB15_02335 [Anaerolineales bacterium]|nr:hypothetical protein [Anaerolineales bacterium]